MDRNLGELHQQLGFIGIFKVAYKMIFTWKKIFTQFTLVFIFPISAILLSFFHLSEVMFRKIYDNIYFIDDDYDYIASRTKWIILGFSTGAYLLVIISLSLLSTSAVVYIIGCSYTATEFSFKTGIIAVLKVCKTILSSHIWPMVLHRILALSFSLWCPISFWCVFGAPNKSPTPALSTLNIYTISLYLVYIITAKFYFKWHVCCLVSIFEEKYGDPAIQKSSKLIDKFQATTSIVRTIQISELLIEVTYYTLIVHSTLFGVVTKVCLGVVCFLLLSKTILLGFVIQSLLYFVCKSYLGENIDKLVLKGRLEGYSFRLSGYVL